MDIVERLREIGDGKTGLPAEAADEIERLREELHYCNGTCDLAMKHRDIAEAKVRALTGREGRPSGPASPDDLTDPFQHQKS